MSAQQLLLHSVSRNALPNPEPLPPHQLILEVPLSQVLLQSPHHSYHSQTPLSKPGTSNILHLPLLNIRLFPSRHADPRHLTIGDRCTDPPSQTPSTHCHLHPGFVQEPGGPSWSVTVGAFEGKGEREHERERRLRRQADDEGFSLVGKFSRADI